MMTEPSAIPSSAAATDSNVLLIKGFSCFYLAEQNDPTANRMNQGCSKGVYSLPNKRLRRVFRYAMSCD
jgi:hypothetical protein